LAIVFLGGRIAASDRQRGTDAGMEAASRWLGVRGYLSGTATFPDLPPAHVVLWDRYLGYATAFGVARACVRALPMSGEPDRRALAVQALSDMFGTRTVEGEALRERTWGSDENITHWVAVDNGKSPVVRAWRVSPSRATEVDQNQVVRARVTPLLGFVRSFER